MLPPPVRFLVLVLGAWAVGRAVVLSLPEEVRSSARRLVTAAPAASVVRVPQEAVLQQTDRPDPPPAVTASVAAQGPVPQEPARVAITLPRPTYTLRREPPVSAVEPRSFALAGLPPPAQADAREGRLGGSAWLFLRGKAGGALAPGGSLGGSQAGGRITYALGRRAALSARAYLPLEVSDEAEVALGVDVAPLPALPVRLLVERREPVGRRGRSAFAATVYGGVGDARLVGPVHLDAYMQAGVVGLRSRDLFADGSARLHVAAGGAKLGGGIWGAAQPGAERLDLGPTVSVPLPVGRLIADWRFRVAGEARPGSGPTLTLAADF